MRDPSSLKLCRDELDQPPAMRRRSKNFHRQWDNNLYCMNDQIIPQILSENNFFGGKFHIVKSIEKNIEFFQKYYSFLPSVWIYC